MLGCNAEFLAECHLVAEQPRLRGANNDAITLEFGGVWENSAGKVTGAERVMVHVSRDNPRPVLRGAIIRRGSNVEVPLATTSMFFPGHQLGFANESPKDHKIGNAFCR